MSPIRKQLRFAGVLPFSIVYKSSKEKHEELPDHLHDWWEILYIHRGKGTFFIEQSFFELEEGDLIIVPPNAVHRSILNKEERLTSTALFFSPAIPAYTIENQSILIDLFKKVKNNKSYHHKLDAPGRKVLERCCYDIYQETQGKKDYWEEFIAVEMMKLMIFMNRWMEDTTARQEQVPENLAWMKRVLDYIETHLHSKIRLEELAEIASISPVYFSRKFKHTVGMPVSQFLVMKRLLKAKELLQESDESIQVIAELTGYQSLPHFFKAFKKATGTTPHQYRKSYIESTLIIRGD